MYNTEIKDKITLEIYNRKNKNIALTILLFFAVVILLVPVVAICILAVRGEGIPFGFIITCTVAFLSSGYLVKLYLWNKYGKEIFIIEKNYLSLYYDYKLFKDNYKKIHFESIQVYFEHNKILVNASLRSKESEKKGSSIICFDIDGKNIKSIGEMPIGTIIEFSEKIKNYRNLQK